MITSNLVPQPMTEYEKSAGLLYHYRRAGLEPEPPCPRCATCGINLMFQLGTSYSRKGMAGMPRFCNQHGGRGPRAARKIASKILVLVIITLLHIIVSPSTWGQGGNVGSNSSPVVNRQGIPLPGVSISVCYPLSTTAAVVTGNIASLTMSSNPVTAGFKIGMTVMVAGFSGGDTYLNTGSVVNGQLTGGVTLLSVTTSTVVFSLTHANASAATNGTVLQQGNATTTCAGLVPVFSDPALTVPVTQPFLSDQLGNWNVFVAPNVYYVQFYSTVTTPTLKQISVSCVPGGAGCTGGFSGSITSGQVAFGTGANLIGGASTFTFNSTSGNLDVKSFENIRQVDAANTAGWAGSDVGAWINAAYADLPSVGGKIDVAPNASGCYSYTTPINLSTASKPVLIDLNTGCLNYTPTNNTKAITLNWGPASGANFNQGYGIIDGSLTNNGCIIATTCGASSATGISIGSLPAVGTRLANIAIGGFSTNLDSPGGEAWGLIGENLTIASGAVGVSCGPSAYENLTLSDGRNVSNLVGIYNRGGCDINIDNLSLDSNKTTGIINNGYIHWKGGHWENADGLGGGITPYYLDQPTGNTVIDGVYILDDQGSGTTPDWITCEGGTLTITGGSNFFSGGRSTSTGVVNGVYPCKVLALGYQNDSPTPLANFFGGNAPVTYISMSPGQVSQYQSPNITNGDIFRFKPNPSYAGPWGITVSGAGMGGNNCATGPYYRVGDVAILGDNSGGLMCFASAPDGTIWATLSASGFIPTVALVATSYAEPDPMGPVPGQIWYDTTLGIERCKEAWGDTLGCGYAYRTIQIAGSARPHEPIINWVAGVTCSDNPGATRTDCTATGSSGANITVNGGAALTSPVNFQTGPAFDGLIINAINPSGSNVDFQLSGAFTDSGISSSYSGVGACGSHLFASTLTRNAAPTCTQPTLADVAAGVAASGIYDFSGVSLKVPSSAAFVTTATKTFGIDTSTTKNPHVWVNGADAIIPVVSGAWVNGNCGNIVFSGGQYAISDNGSPCGSGTTTAFSTLTAGVTSNAGTFGGSGNTWDFSAVTLLKLRFSAGLTTSTIGDCGYDTTNKNWHCWANGADEFLTPIASTPTNNDCAKFTVAASVITLADFGAGCGGTPPTIQTNTTPNASQVLLNFTTSTANAVGLTGTPVNTSGGIEKIEISGGTYSGIAATATAVNGTPTLCSTGQAPTGIAPSFNATGCAAFAPLVGNCSSSASPAVCTTSNSGSIVVAAAATSVVVNTSAVTANSQIILTFDSSLGTKLSVTCNTTFDQAWISARTAGTSFTITASAPVTNPACYSFEIRN